MKIKSLASFSLLALALIATANPWQANNAVTEADKKQTIETLVSALKENYVFPDLAEKTAKALNDNLKSNAYSNVTTGPEFAKLLSEQINAICKDAHLRVRYSEQVLPQRKQRSQPSADEIAENKKFERLTNGGFQTVRRLNGNIGYIEFNGFQSVEAAREPMKAAMDFVANSDALIVDLRDNGGGSPETVQLFCSYFFSEKPVHLNDLYFRRGNQTTEFWTLKTVPGKRYLNKEVYILTSKRTGSAAEECTYNLQNLKRATIVGESTWGGANPGGVVRLNDHFNAFIPSGRAINPYTKTNWEGTGVIPDVKVTPADALLTAQTMALKSLIAKATGNDKTRLEEALTFTQTGK